MPATDTSPCDCRDSWLGPISIREGQAVPRGRQCPGLPTTTLSTACTLALWGLRPEAACHRCTVGTRAESPACPTSTSAWLRVRRKHLFLKSPQLPQGYHPQGAPPHFTPPMPIAWDPNNAPARRPQGGTPTGRRRDDSVGNKNQPRKGREQKPFLTLQGLPAPTVQLELLASPDLLDCPTCS